MNETAFRICLNLWTDKNTNQLDPERIKNAALSDVLGVVTKLVQLRAPVLYSMYERLPSDQKNWVASCGYLYTVKGTKFTFLCTAENRSQIEPVRNNKQFKAEVLTACCKGLEDHFRDDPRVTVRREDKSIMLKIVPAQGPAEFFTVRVAASN